MKEKFSERGMVNVGAWKGGKDVSRRNGSVGERGRSGRAEMAKGAS